jgi:fatty aldehyde-generating acyl-ACP reductase
MGGTVADVTALQTPIFAAIGHQESWNQIASIVGHMRGPAQPALTETQLREIVPWIPPRTVGRLTVAAAPNASPIHGVYIDTFITPDELAVPPTRRVIEKVRDGIRAAEREGARVASLGGFTSILAEAMAIPCDGKLALTTGNTLTAALIVRGVERAVSLLGRSLDAEDLLIIGATGDVGSACARSLVGRTRRLLLAARGQERLEREAAQLRSCGAVTTSTEVPELLRQASIVIAVTSAPAPAFALEACALDAIVCDAGYPKNMRVADGNSSQRVFWGGMGQLAGGIAKNDGVQYSFPVAHAAHGCMLEGAVLAMAGRFEAFSTGRGRITPDRVQDMWRLATACGMSLTPLFDRAGVWPEELAS